MNKRLTKVTGVFFTLLAVSLFSYAYAYVSPGKSVGFVNDFASIISPEKQSELETTLRAFEEKTSHEVVVVTIATLGDDYIENYALKLFEEWKIGKEGADNGILFLIAPNEKKVRIEVGYGLEGALVDSEANTIIQEYVLPAFRTNDYEKGIVFGVEGIISATEGEVVSTKSGMSSNVNWGEIGFFVLFALFWGFNILIQILASSKSWWLGGALGAGAGVVMTVFSFFGITLVLGIILSVFLGVLGLLFDYLLSKNSEAILKKFSAGNNGPWGGAGGFGGGSSGGFGGFGGGRSGGGGSSGGW